MRGFQPAWKSQHKISHLKTWLLPVEGELPPSWRPAPKHKSNNSSDNTLPNITRWCAAQLLPVTRALKSQTRRGKSAACHFQSGFDSLFAASEERTDRPMRPHSSVPSEDHVTQVRPQSLSIDCQVQDVVFTCAFNLYKYYTIRR